MAIRPREGPYLRMRLPGEGIPGAGNRTTAQDSGTQNQAPLVPSPYQYPCPNLFKNAQFLYKLVP